MPKDSPSESVLETWQHSLVSLTCTPIHLFFFFLSFLILGSMKSSPVSFFHYDLGIETIAIRKEWLAINYVWKVCLNSRHSNYDLITSLAYSTKTKHDQFTDAASSQGPL